MKYNYNYKNKNGEYAPYILIVGDKQIINPTEEDYLNARYEYYELPEITNSVLDEKRIEISQLIQQLQETDYILFKSLEGYDCDTLYPEWKEKRKALRDRINELEK